MTSPMFSVPCIYRTRGAKTGENDMGEPIYGPDVDTPRKCWVEPIAATEQTAQGEQYVTTYAFAAPLKDFDLVKGCDQIVIWGTPYHVVGKVLRQPAGLAIDGLTRCTLEEVTG